MNVAHHVRLILQCFFLAWMALAAQVECAGAQDSAADALARIAELRTAGQFAAAEQLAADRLSDSQLADGDRAELTLALSQTLLEHALASRPEQREPLWRQAHETARRFGLEHPRNPRLAQVQLQAALVSLARGSALRQESQWSAQREIAAAGRDALRQAVRELSAVVDRLETELRQRARPRPGDSASQAPLSDDALRHLQRHAQWQLGRALKEQALSFAPRSPERTDSLEQSLKTLNPLAALDEGFPVAWPARVDQLSVLRLLEDYDACASRLAALQSGPPPDAWAPLVHAEALRLAAAKADFATAVQLAQQPRPETWPAAPELDLAELETWLSLVRGAGSPAAEGDESRPIAANRTRPPSTAADWQQRANDTLARIQVQHGPYWSRQAEALLASAAAPAAQGMSRQSLEKTADGLARSGRWEEALAAYDHAAARARDENDAAGAFDLAFRAAAVLHQQQVHAAAAERFRKLALDQWQHPRASEAHLTAVYNAAQAAENNGATDHPETTDGLAALLAEHLQFWPQAPSAGEVRWQLGKWQERDRHWQAAIETYRGIGASHPRGGEAVGAMAGCYRRWLAELREGQQATDGVADAAWQYFVGQTLDDRGQRRTQLGPRELAAVQAAAELRLEFSPRDAAAAESLLREALSTPGVDDRSYQALLPALAWATALLGRQDQVDALVGRLGQTSGPVLATFLERLDGGRGTVPDSARQAYHALQLAAATVALGQRESLSPVQQATVDRLFARALADAGRIDETSRYFERLATERPRDATVVVEHARFLASRDDRASLEAALAKWRLLERGTKPPAALWFEAKLEIARLHERLGNRQQAAKIVTVTQALHPELGGPARKVEFLELLGRCQK